jgi:hypothetical protein
MVVERERQPPFAAQSNGQPAPERQRVRLVGDVVAASS